MARTHVHATPGVNARAAVTAAVALAGLFAAAIAVAQPARMVTGGPANHLVVRGESWSSIASRVGMEPATLARLNNATLKTPLTTGQLVRIDSRHLVPPAELTDGVVINIPQRMLFVKTGGDVVASYPVALGRPTWPTFVGPFVVVASEVNPAWDVPPSIQEELRQAGKPVVTRVAPGPANPLGKYWLGLSVPNFGIHGTNAPRSIYRFETHGCVRLHPDDIADLWKRVSIGTAGAIVYEPVLIGVSPEGTAFLEVHRDIYRRFGVSEDDFVRARANALGIAGRLDWGRVEEAIAARDGMPHVVSVNTAP